MADTAAATIRVQVCYATPASVFLRDVTVPQGATLEQAVAQSGLLQEMPEVDLAAMQVGIYAKKKTLATVLREHDRIEIYRPLIADPKNARRRKKSRE